MNTVAYIRVSTAEQAKEGYSIPAQKERIDAFAKSQGWTITEHYIEEGQSGKDLNRSAAQKLLLDIKSGQIDVVLVYRLDRLTRSVMDLHMLLQTFEKNNVAFRSVTEIYDTTTATGRLFITLVAAMAQWERENLGERVHFGMSEMVRQGRRPGTKEPYGYVYNKENKMLEIIPEQARIIRQIYDLYTKGEGVRKIVQILNDSRTPTKTGRTWADNTVSHILKNPLYAGLFRWDGESFDGEHAAILDHETWLTVQAKMNHKKDLPPRHTTGNYPLTGILKCGLCGGTLNGSTSTQRNKTGSKKVRWYKCSRRDHQHNCSLPFMQADKLEESVIEHLNIEKWKSKIEENMLPPGNDFIALEAELQGMTLKKKKWFDAYEAGVIHVLDLNERLKLITDREKHIREKLSKVIKPKWTPQEQIDKIKNFRWLWEHATPQERKGLSHGLIKLIVVDENKAVEVTLR